MIELNDNTIVDIDLTSSKGNQLKWLYNNYYYKADNNGYEGLAEYVVSKLLKKSNLDKNRYIDYELETIKYKLQIYNGCKSKNFLKPNTKLITIKRLFDIYDSKLMDIYNSLSSLQQKIEFIVNNVSRITGLSEFGQYLYEMCLIDALFLNDDRHLHNVALILNEDNTFDYCPIFDNGAAILSDAKIEYPIGINTLDLIKIPKSKTFDYSFEEIIDKLELLYGTNLTFSYTEDDIDKILSNINNYDSKIIKRVNQILKYQRNKMIYFFN